MKTIIFTFGGTLTDGDLLMVWAKATKGGQSTAKCVVGDPATPDVYIADTPIRRGFRKADTWAGVVKALEEAINSSGSEWSPGSGDYKAVARGNRLSVMASNLMAEVNYGFDVEGAGTETCEVDILG